MSYSADENLFLLTDPYILHAPPWACVCGLLCQLRHCHRTPASGLSWVPTPQAATIALILSLQQLVPSYRFIASPCSLPFIHCQKQNKYLSVFKAVMEQAVAPTEMSGWSWYLVGKQWNSLHQCLVCDEFYQCLVTVYVCNTLGCVLILIYLSMTMSCAFVSV